MGLRKADSQGNPGACLEACCMYLPASALVLDGTGKLSEFIMNVLHKSKARALNAPRTYFPG